MKQSIPRIRKAEHPFQIKGSDRADDRFMSDYIFKKQRK